MTAVRKLPEGVLSVTDERDGEPVLQQVPGGPRHVAIIMDGNGRWATAQQLPRVAGHTAGVDALRRVVRAAPQLGIEVLTLYAFSSENWRRPESEINDLMGLIKRYLLSELDELNANGARLRLIGDWRSLAPDIVEALERAMEATRHNTRFQMVVALNYGAHDEMTRACRTLATEVAQGVRTAESITPEVISAYLDTATLPQVDLIIRTSGEQRLSNFLLWQAAYAEMLFTPVLWPDFDGQTLKDAAECFASRDRRYGGR